MTAEQITRQHRAAFSAPHTQQARVRGELLELAPCTCGLILGFADYHLRRDGQVTIYAIGVERRHMGRGNGRKLIADLLARCPTATSLLAKCPADLDSNGWYAHLGFELVRVEPGKRPLNVWRLQL